MSEVLVAAEQIRNALKLAKVRIYDDPAATLMPPAALVFAPELTLAVGNDATDATFPVLLVVADDKSSVDRLAQLIPVVAQAIHDNVENAVVRSAQPGAYNAGGTVLPCYQLNVEVAL
ncbi:MAG: hypothetical protein HOQ21_09785 [Dermatophilaceae bacterium]|nr:hypothetical protein [Dermatophilaceae bacterium]